MSEETSRASPRQRSESVALLEEKRDFLLAEEATAVDPDVKFRLKKDLEKIQRKLAELRDGSDPTGPGAFIRELDGKQEDAYLRLEEAELAGEETAAIHQEILELKRQIRAGRPLRRGDYLRGTDFRLIERIGRGGFADVWKASRRGHRKVVAIKVLHNQYTEDRTKRQRFFRGAHQMAMLQHQGVVRVIAEHGEDGGYHFFVMEYVEGGDLHQAVVGGSLEQADVLRIIREVGTALAFAHEAGIVHRDVKPSNILLDDAGRSKLTDFDLVRAIDTTGGTRTNAGMGTFLYAAPEILGQAKEADARADLYSLGMTAIFALHGGGLSTEVIRDTAGFIAGLPVDEPCRQTLLRAVAFDREERWQSVSEFCAALDRAAIDRVPMDRATIGEPVDRPPSAAILALGKTAADEDLFEKIDLEMRHDAEATTRGLIATGWWPSWRRRWPGAHEPEAAAMAWLRSDAWNRAACPEATLETWKQVMADLRATSLAVEDVQQLSRDGRPTWPWIPPFERQQIEDLSLLARDLDALALLAECISQHSPFGRESVAEIVFASSRLEARPPTAPQP